MPDAVRREESRPGPCKATASLLCSVSSNPLIRTCSGNAVIHSAKEVVVSLTDAVLLELSTERVHLGEYLRSFDPDGTGRLPVETAAWMLANVAEKWTPNVACEPAVVGQALRDLRIFDGEAREGEITICFLFHVCSASSRVRRALAARVMHTACKRADRLQSADFLQHPVLAELPVGFFRRQPSEIDRESFSKFLDALLPSTQELSVQPYEVDMCWEVLVEDAKAGRRHEECAPGGDHWRRLVFNATRFSVSSIFRNTLTLCIILNAISIMLDDPLCEPVDASGSTLCIFNCMSVTSKVEDHSCNVNLEIVRAKIEFGLLVLFTAEMALILFVERHVYFAIAWNLLDFIVISLSWVSTYVDGPSVTAIRLVKILRLLRALKGYKGMQVCRHA